MILKKLNNSPIIITPNRRLAAHLEQQFILDQKNLQQTAWPSLKAFPLQTWLENLWRESLDSQVLLNKHQECFLWQECIKRISGAEFSGLAATAMEAWNLLYLWKLDPKNLPCFTEDTLCFQQWALLFRKILTQNNWITRSQVPAALISSKIKINHKIILTGFDQIPPQLNEFLSFFQTEALEINNCESQQGRIEFETLEQEIYAMARFAKQQHELNPQANIGCVVPNLAQIRSQIDRIFSELLPADAFNISAGTPMSSEPMISAAFDLLTLQDQLSTETITRLLLNPFLPKSAAELAANAVLDVELRQLNKPIFTLHELINFLDTKKHIKNISLLINELKKITHRSRNIQQSFSYWAQDFHQQLAQIGWPGKTQISDKEFALAICWQKSLQEFASLDLIENKISRNSALKILREQISHTPFQVKSKNQKINILGLLEAAGINFDSLWLMGLDQKTLPPAPTPNPFIPREIAIINKMPHSSADRELEFCENMINRFKKSSQHIVFSHINYENDQEIKPSSLIANVQKISLDNLGLQNFENIYHRIYSSKRLECIDDKNAPEVALSENIKGGSKIFELQALCPFRAFAELRLSAEELPIAEIGIDKKTRGSIIHECLQNIWHLLQSQTQLIATPEEKLTSIIKNSLQKFLTSDSQHTTFLELEKHTLTNLLWRLLEQEKIRSNFAVLATEKKVAVEIGGLKVNLRFDRIDMLDDQSLLIIDYKTGKKLPVISDWLSERPKNIQLPLYCVATNGTHHLAFWQINAAAVNFWPITLEQINASAKDVTTPFTWETLIKKWQTTLAQLAHDFLAGKAEVDPIDEKICDNCKLQSLCRINCNYTTLDT